MTALLVGLIAVAAGAVALTPRVASGISPASSLVVATLSGAPCVGECLRAREAPDAVEKLTAVASAATLKPPEVTSGAPSVEPAATQGASAAVPAETKVELPSPPEASTVLPAVAPVVSPAAEPAVVSVASVDPVIAQPDRTKETVAERTPAEPVVLVPDASAASACVEDVRTAASRLKILFPSGSIQMSASDTLRVVAFGKLVSECAGVRVEVGGHTDALGAEGTNFQLSWQRAEAVVARIRERGIDVRRLDIVGYGARRPAVRIPVALPASVGREPDVVARDLALETQRHAPNRRVDFSIR